MKAGALYCAGSSSCLIPNVRKTASIWERMRGLLARPPLQNGEGLLIAPCPSVHTFGMRYALDLVFLDRAGRVLKLVCDLRPWSMAACANAHAALELPSGSISQAGIRLDDLLEWRSK